MKRELFVVVGLVLVAVALFFLLSSGVEKFDGDEVTYLHPANSGGSSQDCLDEDKTVCLTRGAGGIVYNSGDGDVKLGWGRCDDVVEWQDFDKGGWQAIRGNFDGAMSALVGHDLCFDADGVGKWDVVFSLFKGGSTEGTFEYTRVRHS